MKTFAKTLTPLDFNPWGEGPRDTADIVHLDRMTVADKACTCANCEVRIQPGESCRQRRERQSGKLNLWHWCQACCDAMVKEMQNEIAPDDFDGEPYPFTARGLRAGTQR